MRIQPLTPADRVKAAANMAKLPPVAFARHPQKIHMLALIKRGQMGFIEVDAMADPHELNRVLGVTPAQASAMKTGSIFGFHVPLADPDRYDEAGELKRPPDYAERMARRARQSDPKATDG